MASAGPTLVMAVCWTQNTNTARWPKALIAISSVLTGRCAVRHLGETHEQVRFSKLMTTLLAKEGLGTTVSYDPKGKTKYAGVRTIWKLTDTTIEQCNEVVAGHAMFTTLRSALVRRASSGSRR